MIDFEFDSIEDLEKSIESLITSIAADEKALEAKREKLKSYQSTVKMIRKMLDKRTERQNEAFATLITQRNNEDRVTDADFLRFAEEAGLTTSGLIDDPRESDNPEQAQAVA